MLWVGNHDAAVWFESCTIEGKQFALLSALNDLAQTQSLNGRQNAVQTLEGERVSAFVRFIQESIVLQCELERQGRLLRTIMVPFLFGTDSKLSLTVLRRKAPSPTLVGPTLDASLSTHGLR
jgi:hypothetical protein